jgi:hypothetical protein
LKLVTWFEGFGTCQSYIAQFMRNPDGSWLKQRDNPPLTIPSCIHWNWQRYDGTGEPQGLLTGLLQINDAPAGPPDPGYTPAEWQKLHHASYAGMIHAGKDVASPVWIDYLRASVRQALDAGIDGCQF